MKQEELQKTQALQLKIAKEFKRICDKHNIQYSMSGGTLLGAIRHSGFIPWDDDFDVEMLRDEYERFIQIAPQELNDSFFLETWNTDPHFAFPYAKIMLKGTTYAEQNTIKANVNKNIFIDVFVSDHVSDIARKRNLQCRLCDYLEGILYEKNGYLSSCNENKLKKILFQIAGIVPLKLLQKIYYHFMLGYNRQLTTYTTIFGSCYGSTVEIKPRSFYDELMEYPFADTQFKGFKRYDEYLHSLYGDYMQFPPEDERYDRHKVLKIDFGNHLEK